MLDKVCLNIGFFDDGQLGSVEGQIKKGEIDEDGINHIVKIYLDEDNKDLNELRISANKDVQNILQNIYNKYPSIVY